ncbi:hypothetical protein VTI28DRAFT_5328 [Corynascus sepedonium]
MGNLCSSERDPFSQPGRPLGTTPAAPASASVPASARTPRKVGGPPRTLGGASPTAAPSGTDNDARARAAAAAEERFRKSQQGGGKLKAQLNERRARTDSEILREASAVERGHRDLDRSVDALAHS